MVGIIKFMLDLLEHIITGIVDAGYDCISSLMSKDRKTVFDADFMPEWEVLSASYQGFCVNGKKCISIEDSTKNVLVIGGTGSNKSSGILIPSLLHMRGTSSLIVNDPSGELLLKTSGAFAEAGYTIKTLNFAQPSLSEGYNPFTRATSVSDQQKVSKMLISTALGSGGKDPFWNMAGENLVSFFMRFIVAHTPKEHHTLYQVYHLLSSFAYEPEKIDACIAAANDPALLAEYKTFLTYGDKMLSSIIATCRAALNIFGTDPSVAAVTSHDTIDLDSFRKQKTVLFINTSTKDLKYYSLITSIFLEQCFGTLMSSLPVKQDLPVFFLLDEASSLHFASLNTVISNIRKYNSGILQIYQSASQLTDLYGAAIAKAITENSTTKVYMPGQPISVAQEISETLGKFEFVDDNGARQVRPLMTAAEIRESKESIILCGNNRAVKTLIVPYFKQPKLLRLTQLPPYQPSTIMPFSTPPLLKL